MQAHENVAIGAAARLSGIAASAIRYYEDIGLIGAARRSAGRRYYSAGDIARLAFIRRARDFGMSVDQVRGLLAAEACAAARDLVATRLREVRAKRAELRVLEDELSAMVARCDTACGDAEGASCTILTDMGGRAFVLPDQRPRPPL